MTKEAIGGTPERSDKPVRVAMLQMCSGTDPLANARTIVEALHQAATDGAAMLFAPEMSLMLDREPARASATMASGVMDEAIALVAQAAQAHQLWVHLGSYPHRDGAIEAGKLRNRSLVIDPQGQLCALYDKLHMFDVDLPTGESWRESNRYAAGETLALVDCPTGRLGLSICYDLRFGQLFDRLRAEGATSLAIPAAFTVPTGEAHWHVMLRARAIEQQCFVIAAAQVGTHADGRQTYGHSLVIDPWGKILLDSGGEQPGLSLVELDLDLCAAVRARIPVLSHRRPLPDATVN